MTDHRIRYSIAWLVVLASLFTGAALLLSPSGTAQLVGLALVLAPALGFGAIAGLYYLKSRRQAAGQDGSVDGPDST